MKTATVVAGGRFSELSWNPGRVERHRQDIIRRAVDDSRRGSRRGLGIQRCKNEFVQGMASFRDGWFFDTFTVAAGAAFPVTLLFATPQSGSKLLNSTNLTGQGGQLPAGTTLQVNRIRIEISNLATQADYANIMSNATFEFKVNQVPIYQSMPNYFPAGFGCPTFSAAQVGTAPSGSSVLTSTNNGMPSQNATYEFQNPYQLSSLENFVVVVTPQTAFNMIAASGVNPVGVGVTIRVYLDGLKKAVISG